MKGEDYNPALPIYFMTIEAMMEANGSTKNSDGTKHRPLAHCGWVEDGTMDHMAGTKLVGVSPNDLLKMRNQAQAMRHYGCGDPGCADCDHDGWTISWDMLTQHGGSPTHFGFDFEDWI